MLNLFQKHDEYQYLNLLKKTLKEGSFKEDRTGVGTYSIFGAQMRFDLSKGLPLLTTKKVHFKSVVHELLWFLSGDTNVKYLQDNGVKIWNEWADENGDLGPIYGAQWRNFNGVDQITNLITGLKNDPNSRRHIVSAWNPVDLPKMRLPPCHTMFQLNIADNKISCQLYQRSADLFLGSPFNIASYSLLTYMVAEILDYDLGDFVYTIGDCHIYSNHIQQVKEQLKRKPFIFPALVLEKKDSIFDYTYEDFYLINYNHHPAIKAPIAV